MALELEFKKIFLELITQLKGLKDSEDPEAVPILSRVQRYKGELEEGSQWNPTFPIAFVQFAGYRPEAEATDGQWLSERLYFRLYIGDRNASSPDGLDALEAVIDFFNSKDIQITLNEGNKQTFKVKIAKEGGDLYGYIVGVDAYVLLIEVTR